MSNTRVSSTSVVPAGGTARIFRRLSAPQQCRPTLHMRMLVVMHWPQRFCCAAEWPASRVTMLHATLARQEMHLLLDGAGAPRSGSVRSRPPTTAWPTIPRDSFGNSCGLSRGVQTCARVSVSRVAVSVVRASFTRLCFGVPDQQRSEAGRLHPNP